MNQLVNDADDDENGLTSTKLIALYAKPNPVLDDTYLAGIHAVDWSKISHAYGEAIDVPPLLRALLSRIEDHRDFALHLLFETIWHQGTVYQATAYAVPFLIQLLTYPNTPNKTGILHLLAAIAQRPSADELARAESWNAQHGFHLDVQRYHEYDQTSHIAVLTGVRIYLQLLDESDAEMQAFALYTLAKLPDAAPTITPSLLARFTAEADDRIKGHLLLAFDALLPRTSADVRFFENVFDTERNGVLQSIAALAVLNRRGVDAPSSVIDTLMHVSRVLDTNPSHRFETWAIDARFYPGPWGHDRAVESASAFAALGMPMGARQLITVLAGITVSEVAFIFVEQLLDLVFNGKQISEAGCYSRTPEGRQQVAYWIRAPITPVPREQLTTMQADALAAIVYQESFWELETNLLELYGLPGTRSGLKQWLSPQ